MSAESAAFTAAADEARKIADRLRKQADDETFDDRRLKIAESIGARLVAIKLIELADQAKLAELSDPAT